MAMNQDDINKTIAQIDVVVAKAAVQAILVKRGDGEEFARCRGDKAGVRPKLGRPSPSYTFTNEVKIIHAVKNSLGR